MKKPKFPLDKLKQLDEYAKSLGLTIYDIHYGFEYQGKIVGHKIIPFNISPEYKENHPNIIKGFVQCL